MLNYDSEHKINILSAKDIDKIADLTNQIVRTKRHVICQKNSLKWLAVKKETLLKIKAVEFRKARNCSYEMVRKVESTDHITGFDVHFANNKLLSFRSVRQFKSYFEII